MANTITLTLYPAIWKYLAYMFSVYPLQQPYG